MFGPMIELRFNDSSTVLFFRQQPSFFLVHISPAKDARHDFAESFR